MDGHSLCKRHQDRTVATSNGRTNDIKTVRWRRLMDEHSLCKRHQDRTVATSNVNASSVLLLHRRKAGMFSRIALGKQAVHFAGS